MATLRIGRKCGCSQQRQKKEHLGNNLSRVTNARRIDEDYITQDSEEIEDRLTKKLSQEFSRTESRFLGVLSDLAEFLVISQLRVQSGTALDIFRN